MYASSRHHGVWRSLVARPLWERKAVGSNPATPTECAGSRPRRGPVVVGGVPDARPDPFSTSRSSPRSAPRRGVPRRFPESCPGELAGKFAGKFAGVLAGKSAAHHTPGARSRARPPPRSPANRAETPRNGPEGPSAAAAWRPPFVVPVGWGAGGSPCGVNPGRPHEGEESRSPSTPHGRCSSNRPSPVSPDSTEPAPAGRPGRVQATRPQAP